MACFALCACPLPRRTTPIGVTPVNTGSFAGTYSAEGGSLALQAEAGGRFTGTFDSRGTTGAIEGTQNGAQLVGTATTRDRRSFGFVAYLTANGIEISFDSAPFVRFARTNRTAMPVPPATAMPVAPATTRPAIAPSTELAPAPASPGATGLLFRDEVDGWEIRTPEGWKYLVRGASVVFSSDAEPGLIVVSFQRGVTADQLEGGVAPMLSRLAAVQTGAPRPHRTKGGAALIYELGAYLSDGSEIRARAFAIAGATGAISVLGVAQPPVLEGLRRRIDELGTSARFFSAPPNPAMTALAGAWGTLELCADGTYFDSSTDASGTTATSKFHDAFTTAWTNRPVGAGRWSAAGTEVDGTLKLAGARGTVIEHRYTVQKRDLTLDGRLVTRASSVRCP